MVANPLSTLPALGLADILPSIAAGFGLPAFVDELGISGFDDAVVLLIDGLGAELIAAHSDTAPTLIALQDRSIRSGFPATTATSLTSLGVGAPCGMHGVVGYSFRVEAHGPTLNALRWRLDVADGADATEVYQPEQIQPCPSRWTQLADAGVDVSFVMPGEFEGTPLTTMAFGTGGRHRPASTPDEVRDRIIETVAPTALGRRLVYGYYSGLDIAGHVFGPGSTEWLAELAVVNKMIEDLTSELPRHCLLLATGDHGMIAAGSRIDIDTNTELLAGVGTVAGEARVRHVYTDAAESVQQVWAQTLADGAHVVRREQAIDEGWFGVPTDAAASRIGDVLAVARGETVLTRSVAEPLELAMIGHHGAWTPAEQLVPLITHLG